MDFLEDKASEEVKGKVVELSTVLLAIDFTYTSASQMADIPATHALALRLASIGLADCIEEVFGDSDPDTATSADCYDLLFRAGETLVPYLVKVDESFSLMGMSLRTNTDKTYAETVKELLSF